MTDRQHQQPSSAARATATSNLRRDLGEVATAWAQGPMTSEHPWAEPTPWAPAPALPPDAAGLIAQTPGLALQVHELLEHQERWIRLDDLAAFLQELRQVDPDAADKLKLCNNPECGYVELCPNGDFSRLIPLRCWLRLCPNCAKVIAQRLRDRLDAVIDKVTAQPVPGWTLKHFTPTMKRSGDHARDIADCHTMVKALVHSLWTKRDRRAGAASFLEFGPLGGNLHAHTLAWCRFTKQAATSDEWRRLSLMHRPMWQPWVKAQRSAVEELADGYREELRTTLKRARPLLPTLKRKLSRRAAALRLLKRKLSRRAAALRLLMGRKYSRKGIEREVLKRARRQGKGDFITDIRVIDKDRAVGEVVKYVTKLYKVDPSTGRFETPIADLVALHMALKGKRRAWSFGSFYGVDIDLEEGEEKTEPHECPKCGARLVGLSVVAARALLHLKDANNCLSPGVALTVQTLARPGPGP
jgi:hypothetical protein